MDYEKYLEEAKKKIKTLSKGEEFEVKQLFEPLKWEKLSPSEKRNLGKYFSNSYSEGNLQSIQKIEINKKCANKYKKIGE